MLQVGPFAQWSNVASPLFWSDCETSLPLFQRSNSISFIQDSGALVLDYEGGKVATTPPSYMSQ